MRRKKLLLSAENCITYHDGFNAIHCQCGFVCVPVLGIIQHILVVPLRSAPSIRRQYICSRSIVVAGLCTSTYVRTWNNVGVQALLVVAVGG